MAKNEKTSPAIARLAAKVLAGTKKPTPAEIASLAGAVLTQAPDKKKGK